MTQGLVRNSFSSTIIVFLSTLNLKHSLYSFKKVDYNHRAKYLSFSTNLWVDELSSWWTSPTNYKRLAFLYIITIMVSKKMSLWFFLLINKCTCKLPLGIQRPPFNTFNWLTEMYSNDFQLTDINKIKALFKAWLKLFPFKTKAMV